MSHGKIMGPYLKRNRPAILMKTKGNGDWQKSEYRFLPVHKSFRLDFQIFFLRFELDDPLAGKQPKSSQDVRPVRRPLCMRPSGYLEQVV